MMRTVKVASGEPGLKKNFATIPLTIFSVLLIVCAASFPTIGKTLLSVFASGPKRVVFSLKEDQNKAFLCSPYCRGELVLDLGDELLIRIDQKVFRLPKESFSWLALEEKSIR